LRDHQNTEELVVPTGRLDLQLHRNMSTVSTDRKQQKKIECFSNYPVRECVRALFRYAQTQQTHVSAPLVRCHNVISQ